MTSVVNNNYFVDTKTTCFLCLGEASPPYILYDDDFNEDIQDNDTIEMEKTSKFSLQRIFRYLQLEPDKLFTNFGAPGSPLSRVAQQLVNKGIEFSVICCQDCGAAAERLNTLCEELEFLQMNLDLSVQIILKKLQSSGEITLRKPRSKGVDLVDAVVTGILREKTMEKCRVRLSTTDLPKVVLRNSSQIPPEEISCELDPQLLIIESPSAPEDEDPPMILELNEEDTTTTMSPSPFEVDQTPFKLPTMNEIPHEITSNNLVTCLLCPSSANSVFGRDSLFLRHVTCCHSEFLFDTLKFPHLSPEQFKACCEHVLELELKASEQKDSTLKKNTDQIPGYICSMCGTIFHEAKVALVHLVQTHYEVLAEKITNFLRNPLIHPNQLLGKITSPIFLDDGPKWKCENCGRVFVAVSSLNRHKKSPCETPEQQKTAIATINAQRRGDSHFICDYCGVRCSTLNGKRSHIRRIHLGTNHNRDRTSCDKCGKSMSVSSLNRHKKLSCRRLIERKTTTQHTSSSDTNSCEEINFTEGSVTEYYDEGEEDGYLINVKTEVMDLE